MSIPTNITTELTNLQAQVAAAAPLASASRATVLAIKLNAAQLVTDVQSALVAPNNMLDTWTAPPDPPAMIAGIEGLLAASQDQSNLALMRGVTGRAASNLEQLPS
ncbi:hypothetical protein [Bradyrhizobium erythrophlei]|uniref:Uncharacterized protein n=1 Tax=Bradyrhizobium erythrophlei TaxID=1437360 RepID=A0A1M5NST3_9BRAD|nr:hypothetical protein [Bradyrhizobium erythrophlei]SHG92023.1 hypothetical protein SAMN05443248_3087 [Bradyrhizobium erythrophlei]